MRADFPSILPPASATTSTTGPRRRAGATKRSPADRVRQAVLALCDYRGQVITHSEKAWASITFAGARHTFALVFAGDEAIEAGERFIAALPEHEFTIPGQIVAEAAITEAEHRLLPHPRLAVQCELLLLEDS